MFHLSGSELLFYGGIAVMIAAVLLTAVCVAVFMLTGQKLKHTLEQEYGKQER